jgi:pyruvate dehydrogenase E1 component alpha subunit
MRFATKSSSSKSSNTTHRVKLPKFDTHQCDGPKEYEVQLGQEQGIAMLTQMMTIRRMEMAADALYKQRQIRGFCHLGIGQEGVPVGMEAVLGTKDAIITAYRCHGFALLRGASVKQIIGELLGKRGGVSGGKGGSMHMFGDRFYGGNGIVGAQVPVGTGIAFAQKYREEAAVTFSMYGDGAANQGQVFESFNMAALWKLPVVFVCENNQYGMGTSADRSSALTTFYKRAGEMVAGVRANGQDVLSVRLASQYCREYALKHGPIILELQTYRYHNQIYYIQY